MEKLTIPSYDDSNIMKFGLGVILVVFIFIGGWSSFAPLSASSVAVGQVSADLDKKTVQHLEGGIVESIYVKDGDSVKKGDTLLKLQEVQIKAQLDIVSSQYQDMIGMYARLQAQNNNANTVTYPSELIDTTIIESQNKIFFNTKKTQEDEKKITAQRIEQLKNQSSGLRSVIKSKEQRVDSLSEEIREWEVLYKQKLVDKIRIRELKREKNTLEGDIASAIAELAKITEQKAQLSTEQLLREKEFKKEVLDQMVQIKSQISDLKSKIIASQDTLTRTTITAPISGTVVGLDIHTIGGVIAPGTKILEIVPQSSQLIVVAQVPTTDIDKVQVGLLSDIRFSAFNLNQAHVVEGKVIHVSADSFINETTGMPYYEAKIEVTQNGKEQLKEYNFHLVSGMPAEVMINIGNRTALSYFVKPFTDMLSRSFNEE